MSTNEGGETKQQTCAEVATEEGIVATAQHGGVLVHKGLERGESATESRDQDEPERRREPTAVSTNS